jgi:hypothetical protein
MQGAPPEKGRTTQREAIGPQLNANVRRQCNLHVHKTEIIESLKSFYNVGCTLLKSVQPIVPHLQIRSSTRGEALEQRLCYSWQRKPPSITGRTDLSER